MKKVFTFTLAIMLAFCLHSCSEDEIILPEKDFFIAFEGQSAVLSKSSQHMLKIPVFVAAERGQQVHVNIGINKDPDIIFGQGSRDYTLAEESVDFEFIHGPVLSFPTGAGYDTLRIKALPGPVPGNLYLLLNLESNSAGYSMGFRYGAAADSTSHDRFLIEFIQ